MAHKSTENLVTLGIRAVMANTRNEMGIEGVASTPNARKRHSSRVKSKYCSKDLLIMMETKLTRQKECVVELADHYKLSEARIDGFKEQESELREELQFALNEMLEKLT
ncbi:Uncharacterized protein TCM_033509 [Theobroma cacao]|uniref:Uncharacterized protein n=1 Tax=Theobroma cacao TaxID=3641 RepID=A0A061FID4_THECC|nr:Uncharacterized protein TCM_033509 [Theobroma cacao]